MKYSYQYEMSQMVYQFLPRENFWLFQYNNEILKHFWVNEKMLKIGTGYFKIL